MSVFKKDQLIWAKVRGFPWWPAVVTKSNKKKNGTIEREVNVVFLQENKTGSVPITKIKDYKANYAQFSTHTNKKLIEAVKIADTKYLPSQNFDTADQTKSDSEGNQLDEGLMEIEEEKEDEINETSQIKSRAKGKPTSKNKKPIMNKKEVESLPPAKKLSKIQQKQIRKKLEKADQEETVSLLQRRTTRSLAKSDPIEMFSEPLIYSVRKMRKYNPDHDSENFASQSEQFSMDGESKESSNDHMQFKKYKESLKNSVKSKENGIEEEKDQKASKVGNQEKENKSNREGATDENGEKEKKKVVKKTNSKSNTAKDNIFVEKRITRARRDLSLGKQAKEKENAQKEGLPDNKYQNSEQNTIRPLHLKINGHKIIYDKKENITDGTNGSRESSSTQDYLTIPLKNHSKISPGNASPSSQASSPFQVRRSRNTLLGQVENEMGEIISYLQLKIKDSEIMNEDNIVNIKLDKIIGDLEEIHLTQAELASSNFSKILEASSILFNENQHSVGVIDTNIINKLLRINEILSLKLKEALIESCQQNGMAIIKQNQGILSKKSSEVSEGNSPLDRSLLLRKKICQGFVQILMNVFCLDTKSSQDMTLNLEGQIYNFYQKDLPYYQKVIKILYKLIKLKVISIQELENIINVEPGKFKVWLQTKIEHVLMTKQIAQDVKGSNEKPLQSEVFS